jgi:virulence factor Mce-like protein
VEKQPPTLGRLALMVVFALSCFGLLLYLWTSFGGAVPLAPKGYRFEARFDEATQLADNADVRISGVTVGHVIDSKLEAGRTSAEIEVDPAYVPVPRDTRAILRAKTLLGETYVELTPGDRSAGDLPDGGTLPVGQVEPTVELDEILRSFDPRTRRALQRFLAGFAASLERRGEDLNDGVGNLAPFAEDTDDLLEVLDSQEGAVRRLIRDTGQVFAALGRRRGELAGLVRTTDSVLQATARRNRELRETVRILPVTLRELRPTLAELEALSIEAAPVVRDLRPAGRALAPTLRDATALAPELRELFLGVDRVIAVSRTALPDTTRIVDAAHPLFGQLEPLLRQLVPVVDFLALYEQELVTSFAGVAAATQASERPAAGAEPIRYLRALVPFTAEGFVAAQERLGSNRHNPYFRPRALDMLEQGLESFDCANAASPSQPQEAPPCRRQEPLEFRGRRLAFPHVTADP